MIWPKEPFRDTEITTSDPQRHAYTSYLIHRYGGPKPHSATLTSCLRDYYSCDPRKPGKTRPLLSLFFEKLPIELILQVCSATRRSTFYSFLAFSTLCLPEIFGLLGPDDLLRLARTTKPLRRLLMSRSNTTLKLWRKTFDVCQYLHDHFPGVSEPSVMDFFLGEECQICGLHDVSTYHVAWALEIRACAICLDKSPFCHRGTEKFKHLHRVVWNCARYSTIYGRRIYLEAEIQDIVEHLSTPASQEDMLQYFLSHVESARNQVESGKEMYYNYPFWSSRVYPIPDHVKSKFIELGYIDEDCCNLQYWESELDEQFFPANGPEAWRILRPILEPRLIKIRDARVEKTDRPYRIILIKKICSKYKTTLMKRHMALFPQLDEVLRYPTFVQLLTDIRSSGVRRPTTDFTKTLEEMACLLTTWTEDTRLSLLSMIPTEASSNPELAVFHCTECDSHVCLVSVDSVIIHLARFHLSFRPSSEIQSTMQVQFNTRGSAAIHTLVEAMELDSKTTTPMDLDTRDARLTCLCCPIGSFGKCIKGRDAMPWRDCVSHYTNTPWFETHPTPQWMVLSDDHAADVKRREGPDPASEDKFWSCSHCVFYLGNLENRRTVLKHLYTKHHVRRPKEDIDFFYDTSHYHKRIPRPVKPWIHSPTVYTCEMCPLPSPRLFRLDALQSHQLHVHPSPQADEGLPPVHLSAGWTRNGCLSVALSLSTNPFDLTPWLGPHRIVEL